MNVRVTVTESAATTSPRVPRPVLPFLWLLALLLLAGRATGRGVGRFLLAYDRGAAAAGRAALRAAGAAVAALGPLGRVLRRLLTPPFRLLRRGWDRLGARLLLALLHPLGRYGRALLAVSHTVLGRVSGWLSTVLTALAPLTRRLASWGVAVERAARRLRRLLRRVGAVLARAVHAVGLFRGAPGLMNAARRNLPSTQR